MDTKAAQWKKNRLLTTLLLNRGFEDEKKADEFISPKISDFRDPFKFEKMEKVVDKILEKREKKEKVFIYGDYDVDGITAAVFLVLVFRNIGIEVDYYIPNRMEEGYGLDKKTIDFINTKNGKLVITVDTGVNSIEDVKYAESLGIDVIVTDHHKSIKEEEDDHLLLLNPKLSDTYEFKYLSGAGVALKVAQGIYQKLKIDIKALYQYMDIVMIGTVADVVPMTDENRIIIKQGLKALKKTKVKGLMYLLKYLKFQNKTINTTDVSYFISPLINSLGRIGISKMGADFFLKEDDFEIYNIIEEMKKSNKKRRELEKNIYDEANQEIAKIGIKNLKCIFLSSEKWHPGVIGVVSSRLSVKYNIPVTLIAFKDGIGKASCRSVKGISVFNIFQKMSEKLVRFGGHDLAAGFIVKSENLEEVKNIFKTSIENIKIEKEKKSLKIDAEYSIENIDEDMFETMESISPYGLENPHPLFIDRDLSFENIKKFGVDERHFNGIIRKNGKNYHMVAFDLGHKINEIESKIQKFDIVYYPEKTLYRGEEIFQIRIKDIKIKDDFYEIFTK
ncbi:single-stranded-DNA-specific exonuclease RecJ [Fusobacterium varium]|uniref:Single-stranded-DNA-specific exonuclease RecJ n=1 Tax=Fusobacterium varium ATCC 27725 TaxID=469618 RepID=A0ABN5JJP2_FUSVA|nr:single-stranded-DNA-specific exonuclease RecJ [Fusobacterium varium ATCC 27725]MCF0170516.1 single-stranded-DNA-specific exonuclease RecJ [Fusobacterium varium]OFL89322.1 single-stranded-DNA-specific exonuclease RecJ [Fusobacterium sp. HMSC073F01]HBJ79196.1 single-stranded-DNA-specific exonuclease RecJ [Fusobacterium sp.]MCF2674239.1 single-stranded-DNA-specific exonuclease RecJ [Fusobacterium varium]